MKKLKIDIDKNNITYCKLYEISKQKGISVDDVVNEYVHAGINKDFNFNNLEKVIKKENDR